MTKTKKWILLLSILLAVIAIGSATVIWVMNADDDPWLGEDNSDSNREDDSDEITQDNLLSGYDFLTPTELMTALENAPKFKASWTVHRTDTQGPKTEQRITLIRNEKLLYQNSYRRSQLQEVNGEAYADGNTGMIYQRTDGETSWIKSQEDDLATRAGFADAVEDILLASGMGDLLETSYTTVNQGQFAFQSTDEGKVITGTMVYQSGVYTLNASWTNPTSGTGGTFSATVTFADIPLTLPVED